MPLFAVGVSKVEQSRLKAGSDGGLPVSGSGGSGLHEDRHRPVRHHVDAHVGAEASGRHLQAA